MKYAFFEGKIVPFEDAKISVMTHAFNYGTGVFEGIRGYWNADQDQMFLLKLEAHYKRFLNSCKIMNIKLEQSVEELCELTKTLVQKNGYKEDAYVRPLAYKSSKVIGVRLHNLDDDLVIFMAPFGDYLDVSKGINVCVSSWTRIDDGMIPARAKITGAYVNSAFSKSEAMLDGYDEAIVLTKSGHVAEGSAENFFMIRDGVLITPSVSDDILEGITRAEIIAMAQQELGLKVIERSVDRTELYIADEIFLVGTGAQVSPVATVDKRPVGTGLVGPITKQLQELYFNAAKGNNPKYKDWLTPVY